MARFLRRLVNALSPGRAEDDLARETAAHLALLEDDYRRRGMSADEARLAARRAFGGVEQMKDRHRDARSFVWLDDLRRDVAYAVRALRHSPGFMIAVVLTIALGLGANAAVFTVVNAVLIERPAFRDADRLVTVWEESSQRPGQHNVVSPANLAAWDDRAHAFEAVAAYFDARANLTLTGDPEEVVVQRVTAPFFPALGVSPLLGRTFTEEEHRTRRTDVVVLGYELWQRRFGGDASVVGRAIAFNGVPSTVIGVMPRGFAVYLKAGALAGKPAELWAPHSLPANARDIASRSLTVVARLKPGVTPTDATREMTAIASALASEFPDRDTGWTARVVPLQDEMSAPYRDALFVLAAAVALVLLIACANVANLLLARGLARQREIAIRLALGAGRGRIVRQLTTEAVVLAAAGALAGLAVARAGIDALLILNPVGVVPAGRIAIGAPVLLFTAAAALVTALVCGIAPAWASVRADVQARLKQGHSFRDLIVVSEIALASMLLVGAGLMVRSFDLLRRVDPGFDAGGLLTLRMQIPPAKYADEGRRVRFFQDVETQVQALPGVRAVGVVSFPPFAGSSARATFTIEGAPPPQPGQAPSVDVSVCDTGYFSALSVPLIAGRFFTDRETHDKTSVVIVNRSFARAYFPNADPIGKRIAIAMARPPQPTEIVGVVDDIRAFNLWTPPRPTAFWPHPQLAYGTMTLTVKTSGDPLASAATIAQAVRRVDKDQPVSDVRTMTQWIDRSQAQTWFITVVLSAFSGFALLLAAIGIFGVMAHAVARRTPEIGIRVALGADARAIIAMVMREGMTLAAVGAIIGLGLAAASGRLLTAFLFGISAIDPATFGAAAITLLAVGVSACYLPARRATQVDPVVALRSE